MAVPVQLEIFMKDLTKAGLQSVGKNVDDVETQTRQLISALQQVIAAQKKQLEVNKAILRRPPTSKLLPDKYADWKLD